MHLVVDGYNLLAALQGGLGEIEEGRGSLVSALSVLKRLRRVRITVVFDGRAGLPEAAPAAGIEVIFSRGKDADSVIRSLVETKGSGLTIVTSDNEVASYAEKRGAVVVGSREFSSILDDALYEDAKGGPAGDEEERGPSRRGPSRRPSSHERAKERAMRKLRGL